MRHTSTETKAPTSVLSATITLFACNRQHIADHGESPTMQQIGAAVGMRSRASVHCRLGE
ncbi:LexA family protein [Streptomyces bungoensis]